MSTPHFRPLLKQAAIYAFTLRKLMLFGLIATLIGSGGELDIALKSYDRLLDLLISLTTDGLAGARALLVFLWSGLIQMFTNHPIETLLVLVVYVAVALGLLWLLFVAKGVLLGVPSLTHQKKRYTIKEVALEAHKNYWSFFTITAIECAVKWVPFGIMAIALTFLFPNSLDFTAPLLLLFLFVPISFIAASLVKLALTAIMVDGQSLRVALATTISLFKKNWLTIIEFGVITLCVGILIFTAGSFIAFMFFVPFLLLSAVFGALLSVAASSVAQLAGFVLFFLVLLFAAVFFTVFEHAAWSLFYGALQRGEVESKIVRWLKRT